MLSAKESTVGGGGVVFEMQYSGRRRDEGPTIRVSARRLWVRKKKTFALGTSVSPFSPEFQNLWFFHSNFYSRQAILHNKILKVCFFVILFVFVDRFRKV